MVMLIHRSVNREICHFNQLISLFDRKMPSPWSFLQEFSRISAYLFEMEGDVDIDSRGGYTPFNGFQDGGGDGGRTPAGQACIRT